MRIKDITITTISISISTLGILLLLIISNNVPETTITKINFLEDNTQILLNTTIISTTQYKNTTFITLQDTCEITGIIEQPVTIEKGTKATITGKIETYKGKKQIRITKIEYSP